MPITLLTPETIGKIAAGEVVERPASVVKELVENSIDAGATRISVEIERGGSDLIVVSDDGCGMSPADLPIAIQRHATSKLTSFDDLDRIRSRGFRGEALPSIGAVSELTIRSRTATEPTGGQLEVIFGSVAPVAAASTSVGTTVIVRDLFANVPARKKFLRQVSTEAAYITRAVGAYAQAFPAVSFSLAIDGRRVLHTDGRGDLVAAVVGVLGAEVGQAILQLEPLDTAAAVPGVDVSGWVSAPPLTKSHRQGLVFFVNGRWIQNRALQFALEEAYHSLIMVGRHPLATVVIEVDPAAVDVNVHPTKAEVRFLDERAVCRAVQRATHAALSIQPHDSLPEVQFGETLPARPTQQFLAPDQDGFGGRSNLVEEPDHDGSQSKTNAHPSGVPILRVLGQIGGAYIVAEGPDGMYMIDQHAAHERVMYEKILAQLARKMVDRQPMLDPLIVDLSPVEMAAFERSQSELHEIGFDVEAFGDGLVAIRAVPALATNVDIAERLRLVLQELADGGAGDSWLDSVAISAACHTSIRAGQPLSLQEMRELVAELERSSQPRACGHGRPTMVRVTQNELERQFARR